MIINLIYIILLLANCVISVLPLKYSKQKQASWAFFLVAISTTFWMFCLLIANNSDNPFFWYNLDLIGSATIPFSLVAFLLYYPKKHPKITPIKIFLLAIPNLILLPITQSSLTAYQIDGKTFYGIGFYLFAIYFLIYMIGVIYLTYRGLKTNKGFDRIKLKYFATGFIISIALSSITNLILPLLGTNKFYILGGIFPSVFIFFTAYSLLKNQLFDITIIINRSIAWLMSITFLLLIYFSIHWVLKSFFSHALQYIFTPFTILYWLTVSFIFPHLRLRLQSTADKLFLKGKYDYKQVLIRITESLTKCTSIKDLLINIEQKFTEEIEIYDTNVFLPENFEDKKELSSTLCQYYLDKDQIQTKSKLNPTHIIRKYIAKYPGVLLTKNANDALKKALLVFKAEAVIPCIRNDKLFALLFLSKKLSEDTFTDDDVTLFTTLSTQIPIVLNRIKQNRVAAEMDVAKEIQMEILPKTPELPGLELACFMTPAVEVGGDYYDVFKHNELSWLVLGDVTGHGVGSGLVMFMVQSILSTLIQTKNITSPSELNFFANQILTQSLSRLSEQRPMTIVTVCTKDGRNFKISGNHDNIYIYRAKKKEIETLSVNHIPFGIGMIAELEKELFEEDTFKLEKNDLLFIATDGIVESPKNGDFDLEQFGEERLIKFLEKNATEPLEKIKKDLMKKVDKFTNEIYPDDITFIIARAV